MTIEIDYPELFPGIFTLLQENNYALLGRVSGFQFTPLSERRHIGGGDYIFAKKEFVDKLENPQVYVTV